MFLSPLFRKAVLCCCLALALKVSAVSGADFLTNGGEYSISGALAGDQSYPDLAITAGGGYLVWEDNSVDGSGQGISAQALDSNFQLVGKRFRVNQNRTGDQERPRVALLNGGGAVFVWQSRPRTSDRHVFARFLSSSNTWVSGDIMVNSSTKAFQINPVVTTLNNGHVAIAYSSFNQQGAGSMHDVYVQILSASGQKIGSEFLANQYTTSNQRTPAIAGLNGGGFMLAWVSESQRYADSIDIFGRLFNENGAPVNNEFMLNAGNTNLCANPSLAPTADGGFIVAWGELDNLVLINGWDVFARSFSATGTGATVQALNAYKFGYQFAPKISSLPAGALAIWTSLAQDGSREGVYGRFLDAAGNISGDEIRVNTTTVGGQKFPVLGSDHASRFLGVWSSFTGVSSGVDLYAQVYASPDYIAASSSTNYFPPTSDPFVTDNGGSNPGPGLPPGGDTSGTNGTPKGLLAAKGTYYGEFYDVANGVSAASAGSFGATVTDRGTFTAKIIIHGKTYAATGKVDSNGDATVQVGKGKTHFTLQLNIDLAGVNQITGTITDGQWTADLYATRLTFSKTKSSANNFAGSYTLRIPADALSSNSPAGDGFASIKIDMGGGIQLKGTLADGTKISEKTAISEQGYWPLFVSLYKGQGALVGWLQVTNNSGMGGQIVWTKPVGAGGKNYPAGFTNKVDAAGAPFQKLVPGHKVFQWTANGQLVLSGGGLSSDSTTSVNLDLNNKITGSQASNLKLSIAPTTGLFQGSLRNPDSGKLLKFQGAISQDTGGGYGYFLNSNQSGHVTLEEAP